MTMKRRIVAAGLGLAALAALAATGCSGAWDAGDAGDLRVTVAPGDEWMHQFSTFVENPPQYALWIEDESGVYQGTLFVTRKIATEGWIFNDGERRAEALPVWVHRRNVRAGDGRLLPSEDDPVIDGIVGATPKEKQVLGLSSRPAMPRFTVFIEVNHSTDFNGTWPEDAAPGSPGWSGGDGGSGQPSLVYSADVDTADPGPWDLVLRGRGSADGSDGAVDPDIAGMTSALGILGSVRVEKNR